MFIEIFRELSDLGIEPIPDPTLGDGYRCAVRLLDDTLLPCVIVRNAKPYIDLTRQLLEQEGRGAGPYKLYPDPVWELLATQLTQTNVVSAYEIAKVERSPFAPPLSLLEQVGGETAMAYTAFVLEDRDGQCFSFSTSHHREFFELPEGRTFADFVKVHRDSVVDDSGVVRSVAFDAPDVEFRPSARQYRPKTFFECYVNSFAH